MENPELRQMGNIHRKKSTTSPWLVEQQILKRGNLGRLFKFSFQTFEHARFASLLIDLRKLLEVWPDGKLDDPLVNKAVQKFRLEILNKVNETYQTQYQFQDQGRGTRR